jgi:hypothetical protein
MHRGRFLSAAQCAHQCRGSPDVAWPARSRRIPGNRLALTDILGDIDVYGLLEPFCAFLCALGVLFPIIASSSAESGRSSLPSGGVMDRSYRGEVKSNQRDGGFMEDDSLRPLLVAQHSRSQQQSLPGVDSARRGSHAALQRGRPAEQSSRLRSRSLERVKTSGVPAGRFRQSTAATAAAPMMVQVGTQLLVVLQSRHVCSETRQTKHTACQHPHNALCTQHFRAHSVHPGEDRATNSQECGLAVGRSVFRILGCWERIRRGFTTNTCSLYG